MSSNDAQEASEFSNINVLSIEMIIIYILKTNVFIVNSTKRKKYISIYN